jgi:hypothetical protein
MALILSKKEHTIILGKDETYFDPSLFYQIEKGGRLAPLEELAEIGSENSESFAGSACREFILASEYVFDTNHLASIMAVLAPANANAYGYVCKNNVLTLKFYSLAESELKSLQSGK